MRTMPHTGPTWIVRVLGMCCVTVSWAQTPSVSKYGSNDRLGALNELTPQVVLQAVQLVKTGKVYSLAIETGTEDTAQAYRVVIQPVPLSTTNKITGFVDTVTMSQGLGTSMDGLGHAGRDEKHYNGVRAAEIYSLNGAQVFSIASLPPIVSRGILLDVARHRGMNSVATGTAINRTEIQETARSQGISLRRGDVVLLHTGSLDSRASASGKSSHGEPGLGKDGALFLAGIGVVAVGADTAGVEVDPAESKGEYAPAHQLLLVDNGIYLFENVDTRALAADRAYEFLFIAAAPRLRGTVQSTLHPIAIR